MMRPRYRRRPLQPAVEHRRFGLAFFAIGTHLPVMGRGRGRGRRPVGRADTSTGTDRPLVAVLLKPALGLARAALPPAADERSDLAQALLLCVFDFPHGAREVGGEALLVEPRLLVIAGAVAHSHSSLLRFSGTLGRRFAAVRLRIVGRARWFRFARMARLGHKVSDGLDVSGEERLAHDAASPVQPVGTYNFGAVALPPLRWQVPLRARRRPGGLVRGLRGSRGTGRAGRSASRSASSRTEAAGNRPWRGAPPMSAACRRTPDAVPP